MSEFANRYEAYMVKRDLNGGGDIYGTFNKVFNVCASPWYKQGWTTHDQSKQGNGVIYKNEVVVDRATLNTSKYFLILGLPYDSPDMFTFI